MNVLGHVRVTGCGPNRGRFERRSVDGERRALLGLGDRKGKVSPLWR